MRERELNLNFDVSAEFAGGLLHDEALRRGFGRFHADSWRVTKRPEIEDALWKSVGQGGITAVLELGSDALGLLRVGFGHAFAQAAAASDERALAALDELRALAPQAERDDDRVHVSFWSYGPHGPMPMGRQLFVPAWADIEGNYAAETAAALGRVMAGDMSWRGGQLLLWHGETGTGKTTALRALARQWASWCELHYITDPEKFFGAQADYMLSVMLAEGAFPDEGEGEVLEGMPGMWMPVPAAGVDSVTVHLPGRPNVPSWRLLVLEDTGELLSADARAQAGQGLSRFLNVVDGLIGQGLRVLVLVTTNEEIGNLHPAVARPGRCAANILFPPLSSEEANAWLAARGQETEVDAPMTLASLYARIEGWDAVAERQATGFG